MSNKTPMLLLTPLQRRFLSVIERHPTDGLRLTNREAAKLCGCAENTLKKTREMLRELGLITFEVAQKKNEITIYKRATPQQERHSITKENSPSRKNNKSPKNQQIALSISTSNLELSNGINLIQKDDNSISNDDDKKTENQLVKQQKSTSKNKKISPKEEPPETQNLHKDFVKAHYDFFVDRQGYAPFSHEDKTGMGRYMATIKRIIKVMRRITSGHLGLTDEARINEAALKWWKRLFEHWGDLTPFQQSNNVTITKIEANLETLFKTLKEKKQQAAVIAEGIKEAEVRREAAKSAQMDKERQQILTAALLYDPAYLRQQAAQSGYSIEDYFLQRYAPLTWSDYKQAFQEKHGYPAE